MTFFSRSKYCLSGKADVLLTHRFLGTVSTFVDMVFIILFFYFPSCTVIVFFCCFFFFTNVFLAFHTCDGADLKPCTFLPDFLATGVKMKVCQPEFSLQ